MCLQNNKGYEDIDSKMKKTCKYSIMMTLLFAIIIIIVFFTFRTNASDDRDNWPKIIIDTDGGADDAMATMILLSTNHKPINVLAITTTYGNTNLTSATRNIILTLNVMNRSDITVHMGSSTPIIGQQHYDNFYGADGFGEYFPSNVSLDNIKPNAVMTIVQLVKKYPGEVSLLCIGPLTNVALAMRIYPPLLSQIKNIYVMGGSTKGEQEYNFKSDPEAASIVFENTSVIKDKSFVLPWDPIDVVDVSLEWRKNVLGKVDSLQMEFINIVERVALKKMEDSGLPYYQEADPVLAIIFVENEGLEEKAMKVSNSVIKSGITISTCPEIIRGNCTLLRNVTDVELTSSINATVEKQSLIMYLS